MQRIIDEKQEGEDDNRWALRLPIELLHLIFDFLDPVDLSRCACVCKLWHDVVFSLDNVTWKRHFGREFSDLQPCWPFETAAAWRPPSWRLAYRYQYLMRTMWMRRLGVKRGDRRAAGGREQSERHRRHERAQVGRPRGPPCTCVPRRPGRRVLRVDRAPPAYVSVRNAIIDAHPFDRIEVCTGVYDETEDVPVRSAVELVGLPAREPSDASHRSASDAVIAASLIVKAQSARFAHLTLKSPWYSNYALQVHHGYLQVEHCRFEDCRIVVQSEAVCVFRYCHFRRAPVTLSRVHRTLFENCLFESFDLDLLSVIGAPKKSQVWVNEHLEPLLRWYDSEKLEAQACESDGVCDGARVDERRNEEQSGPEAAQVPAKHDQFSRRSIARILSVFQRTRNRVLPNTHNRPPQTVQPTSVPVSVSNKPSPLGHQSGLQDLPEVEPIEMSELSEVRTINLTSASAIADSGIDDLAVSGTVSKLTQSAFPSALDLPEISLKLEIEPESELAPSSASTDAPGSSKQTLSVDAQVQGEAQAQAQSAFAPDVQADVAPSSPSARKHHTKNALVLEPASLQNGTARVKLDESENVASHSEHEHSDIENDDDDFCNGDWDADGDADGDGDALVLSGSQSLFRRFASPHTHANARKVSANAAALNEFYSLPIEQRRYPRQNAEAWYLAKRLKGVLIRGCKFANITSIQSASGCGVSATDGAECCVLDCEFASLFVALRVTQATAVVYRNHVHDCRSVGLSFSQYASGAIVCNDVHHCAASCIDVQRYADPIIQSNRVHHSDAHGVLLTKASALILNNDIFANRRDGVVLHRAEAIVSGNRVSGHACGVHILLDSRALVTENIVTLNRLSGIHINCIAKRADRDVSMPTRSRRAALHDSLRRTRDPAQNKLRKTPLCIAMCNYVCSGLQDGVSVGPDAVNAVVVNNVIVNNRACGVWMQSPTSVSVCANQISANREHGIANVHRDPKVPASASASAPASAASQPAPDALPTQPTRQRIAFPVEFAPETRIVRLRMSGFLDSRTLATQKARMKLDFEYYARAAIEFNPSVHEKFKQLLVEQGGDVMHSLLQFGWSVGSFADQRCMQPGWRIEANTAFQNGQDAICLELDERIPPDALAQASTPAPNAAPMQSVKVLNNTCFANRANGISIVMRCRRFEKAELLSHFLGRPVTFNQVMVQSNHVSCNSANGISVELKLDAATIEGVRSKSSSWSYSMANLFSDDNSNATHSGNAGRSDTAKADGARLHCSVLASLEDNGVYDNLENGITIGLHGHPVNLQAEYELGYIKMNIQQSDILGNGLHALRVVQAAQQGPNRFLMPKSVMQLELDVAQNRMYSNRNMVVQLPDDASDAISASILQNTILTDDPQPGSMNGCSYAVPFWLDATDCRGLKIDGNQTTAMHSVQNANVQPKTIRPMLNHYQLLEPALCPRVGLQSFTPQKNQTSITHPLQSDSDAHSEKIRSVVPTCAVTCCTCTSKTCTIL